ncbi:hypothetical protein DFH29DRAFT_881749 [Suillus ampliporus]|nr:hypothetical protein DFH29DRAFT_881749 [Suillus ampliporus]
MGSINTCPSLLLVHIFSLFVQQYYCQAQWRIKRFGNLKAQSAFAGCLLPSSLVLATIADLPSLLPRCAAISPVITKCVLVSTNAVELHDEADEATANLDNDKEDQDTEEAYEHAKAFGDADRDHCKALKKDECTADLQTIFTKEKGHKNLHTGKSEDGRWSFLFNNVFSKAVFQHTVHTLPTI